MISIWVTFERVKESSFPDKVQGANMRLIWGRQDPGGPRVGPMKLIWVEMLMDISTNNTELQNHYSFQSKPSFEKSYLWSVMPLMVILKFCIVCQKSISIITQIANFIGPTWGPPGSCRPQMGPMLAPWFLLLW